MNIILLCEFSLGDTLGSFIFHIRANISMFLAVIKRSLFIVSLVFLAEERG